MSKKTFEHYINLVIIDSSIKVCDKTDFSTFKRFGDYIEECIKANDRNSFHNIQPYLTPILTELTEVLSIPIQESAKYVGRFYKNRVWVKYYKPMKDIKEQFGGFIV